MTTSEARQNSSSTLRDPIYIFLLLTLAVLIASYALLRYGGRWGETDTHTFSRAIRSVIDTRKLAPDGGQFLYTNGYGYSAMVVFLMNMCGLSLPAVQIFASPLLMVWIVLPAWLLYRELTESSVGATLATVFLLVQPEFLFVVLRGTHEKFTRGLMLLCLFLLVRSFRSRNRPFHFAALVVSFYVAAYSMITFNNLMATSFIVAIGVSLILGRIVTRKETSFTQTFEQMSRRLLYVTVVLVMISFAFVAYIYPPALQGMQLLQSIWKQLAVLFLNVENQATNPYSIVGDIWISPWAYFLVSLANWILLVPSFIIWARQTMLWLSRRSSPRNENNLMLWSLYAAFAVQGILSTVIDISGALASNLQHRIFPSFVMLAAPLVARWIVEWKSRNRFRTHLTQVVLPIGIGILSVLSLFKATNEPLLSNKWLFYIPGEMHALDWAETALPGRALWSEFDERVFAALRVRTGAAPRTLRFIEGPLSTDVRDVLLSDVTRVRSTRLGRALPVHFDDFITYDNGSAQVIHRRPHTEYQP